MKKLILMLLIFGFCFSVLAISSLEEENSNLEEKLAEEEIEVIITEIKNSGELNNLGSGGIRAASGEKLRRFISKEEIEIKNKFSTFEGFSAKVTRDRFEELKKNPNYNVRAARLFYASLDDSIPYVGADTVWNLSLNGDQIEGKGQTICIIDTGVNYTHSAFGNCYGNNDNTSSCTVLGGYDFVNNDSDPIDDEGHGTHVAGIAVSSNSTYKGVSSESKIIAIKALDNGGSGLDTDIIAGIDWCVNNASKFNISVISMSLSDCTNWSVVCDNNGSYNDSWVPAINAAIAANITVIAAAGNGPSGSCGAGNGLGDTNGPAGPACISNVTSVGAVRDTDDAFFYQRGALFQLQAPGLAIMSSVIGGGFGSNGGTSMATPHVAGMIALIQQVSKIQDSRFRSPKEIEHLLNNTGAILNDTSGTNLNFTRVDIYDALISIDSSAPSLILAGPENGSTLVERDFNFTCNVSDWQLENMTFNLWNETSLYYNNSTNLSGLENSSTFERTSLPKDTYFWNCESFDTLGNYGISSNYTFTNVDVLVDLISPVDSLSTGISSHNYSCNISSDWAKISNMTLYIWNESTGALIYNETANFSGVYNLTNFTYDFLKSGNYSWNCNGINNQSNSSWGNLNWTIEFDGDAPIISNIGKSSDDESVTVTWDTNEPANSSIMGDIDEDSSSLVTSHSLTQENLDSDTEYEFYIYSCDILGNCANSTQQSQTTDEGASGGGGSSSSSTTTDDDEDEEVNETVNETEATNESSTKLNATGGKEPGTYDSTGEIFSEETSAGSSFMGRIKNSFSSGNKVKTFAIIGAFVILGSVIFFAFLKWREKKKKDKGVIKKVKKKVVRKEGKEEKNIGILNKIKEFFKKLGKNAKGLIGKKTSKNNETDKKDETKEAPEVKKDFLKARAAFLKAKAAFFKADAEAKKAEFEAKEVKP